MGVTVLVQLSLVWTSVSSLSIRQPPVIDLSRAPPPVTDPLQVQTSIAGYELGNLYIKRAVLLQALLPSLA
jgi:hypothetical protein